MTPEKAVARAFWIVQLPSMFFLIAPLAGAVVLMELEYIPSTGTEGLVWFVVLFAPGFLLSWLVWSLQVPRWRLWAYRRVDDLDKLKRLGVESKILWPEGHVFGQTEIASQKVRAELKKLEQAKRKK